jgi:hypothetical protein
MKIAATNIVEGKARVIASYTNDTPIVDVNLSVLPEPEKRDGKIAQLFVNPTTGEVWYEYLDAPMSETEQILNEKNASLTQQLAQVNGNFAAFVDQYYIDNPDKA